MALIATINGKPVHSNKRMKSIINGRVTFDDGSWCDVNTGQVQNNGSGYISIGGSDGGSNVAKITEGPKRVSASALEIRGINADVKVDVAAGTKMDKNNVIEYTVTGPADQVKAIRANVQGTTLVIESDSPGSSGGGTTVVAGSIIQSGRGRTVVSGGDVFVGRRSVMSNVFGRGNVTSVVTGGGSDENDLRVTVKVPAGTSVHANGVLGDVKIGDTDGPLTASVSSGAVYAGRVTSAQLMTSSSGDIRVKRVDGTVVAQASSSGEIRVDDGDMPSLVATASSSGSIDIRGTATTAMLSASSSGDIRVARVRQQPTKSESSSGSVRVRRIG